MPCCILSAADGLPVEASPFSFKAGISFSVTCYIIFRFWQLIQLKERLTDYERKRKHKEGLYLFYSEKDYCCYSFKYDDKGFLVEDKDYDLKKLRLVISDEPVSLNPKESSSPQSSDLYIHDDKLFVNELFFSLLHRGEIDSYKLNHLPFSADDTA